MENYTVTSLNSSRSGSRSRPESRSRSRSRSVVSSTSSNFSIKDGKKWKSRNDISEKGEERVRHRSRKRNRDKGRYRRWSSSKGTSSRDRNERSGHESSMDGEGDTREKKYGDSHMAYVLDTLLKGQQKLAMARNQGEREEVGEKVQRLIDRKQVKKAVQREDLRIEKVLKERERDREEKMTLMRIRTRNNMYPKASERHVQRAKEAFQRRIAVKVRGESSEEIKFFLSEALDIREEYQLEDQQILTVMCCRTQGRFRTDIIRHITLKVPLSEAVEELQLFSEAPVRDRIEAERAVEEYKDTKYGIKNAAKELLVLVRQYAGTLRDTTKEHKEEEIKKLFRKKVLTLLPVEEARRAEKQLEDWEDKTPFPREVMNIITRRERQINAILLSKKHKVGTVRKEREGQIPFPSTVQSTDYNTDYSTDYSTEF